MFENTMVTGLCWQQVSVKPGLWTGERNIIGQVLVVCVATVFSLLLVAFSCMSDVF